MAEPTNYYVDPSIAADSGTGTIGDPFGDLQYALNTITRDATNGDQINIKAGTDEVLTAAVSLATYGTPTAYAALTLRGYTSAANDGGIGQISGNGLYSVASNLNYVNFIDLKLHNCGSQNILNQCAGGFLVGCELTNTSGSGCAHTSSSLHSVHKCYFHDIGTYGVYNYNGGSVTSSYFKNGATYQFSCAIFRITNRGHAIGNIISVSGNSSGIDASYNGLYTTIRGNSVYSTANGGGTGIGIMVGGTSASYGNVAMNNMVEGFSVNYSAYDATVGKSALLLSNASYNGGTDYSANLASYLQIDNETLTASPFAKVGADTFANRFNYFAPTNVGNVIGGAW